MEDAFFQNEARDGCRHHKYFTNERQMRSLNRMLKTGKNGPVGCLGPWPAFVAGVA